MEVVQRPFQAAGLIRIRGEVVDSSGWKHGRKLVEQRYLAPFFGESLECAACGRKFVDLEVFRFHAQSEHPRRNPDKLLVRKEENDNGGG